MRLEQGGEGPANRHARAGRIIGRRGEDAVCEYLIEHGHSIAERNWRCGHLEVDIISIDRDGIHFVEVKSRTAPSARPPESEVGGEKQRRIASAARKYMQQHAEGCGDMECWLDIAAVTFDGGRTDIEYFKGAYVPLYF